MRRRTPGAPQRELPKSIARRGSRLAASGLSWTVICPTYLPDGEPQGQYRAERDYLPEGGMSISVGDTAAFTYRAALEGEYVGCRMGIAY